MPRLRPFQQVDVFTDTLLAGNPLAVVLDAQDLSDDAMQRFAAWTQLSETTFVLPPSPAAAAAGADYHVRIFTPAYEMPFAGHPTLGTCHAWLAHGGIPQRPDRIVQQCAVGLVPLERQEAHWAFAAPALQRQAPSAALWQALPGVLGLAPSQIRAAQQLCNGPSHVAVLVHDAGFLPSLQLDRERLQVLMAQEGFSGIGVAAPCPAPLAQRLISRSNREARAFGKRSAPQGSSDVAAEPDWELRFFFDRGDGVAEDPITGSFNASLAQWLIAEGHARAPYVAAQGASLGRAGRVHIRQDASGQVWVGGAVQPGISGQVWL